jgi:hypothetical protein
MIEEFKNIWSNYRHESDQEQSKECGVELRSDHNHNAQIGVEQGGWHADAEGEVDGGQFDWLNVH